MTIAALDLPQTTDPRVKEPLELATQARAIVVTRENKVDAEQTILLLNDAEKKVRAVMDPVCDAANVAHKTATGKRAELLRPIEEARAHLRRGCGDIQRVLDQEAAAEARRKSEALAAEERERLQRQAEQLADTDVDAAMEVLEQADQVTSLPASTLKVEPAKAVGISYRDNWTFGYVDAQGRPADRPDVRLIPIEYLKVDEVAIRKVVSGLKDRAKIPGVRVFNDRQPVQSGGRR